jgi:serine/threonine protein kinase
MSSPGLLSPSSNSPHPTPMLPSSASANPTLIAARPAPPPAQPVHSYSESAAAPLLHPLQKHKVRETHKALIDSHEVTGRKLINQYEVIEELGRGMHGKVKLARHRNTGDSVAIKIIPRFSKKRRLGKVMVSPQDKTKKEIAILKKIRHENVVALLEVIDDPELKKIYMVLQHVELGEIIWRKKGLPSICQYERKRIEREMQGDALTAEEERYYSILEHRAALNEVRRVKQLQLGHGDYMWSLEHGSSAGDSSPSNRSRIPSRDDLAQLESAVLSSTPGSVEPSRDTSRAPSRSQSIRSMAPVATTFAADVDRQHSGEPHAADGPRSFRSQHGSALFEQSLGGFYVDDSAFRGRSPSMAESLFSHMSSIDLNTHHEDPFADDYSYVPCFTIEQARSTFRDTVLGLEYLHYQGVVHRDIKPANLLWTKDHHVKISDFGVSYFGRPIRDGEPGETVSESEAQDFDDDLELAKTVGTPAFFAPELCYTDPDPDKEPPKVSEQIDVWSLGVTLYCLIFARIPFLAEDEYQMFKKIAEQEVYIPKRRLRPVDTLTTPTSTSLYKSHSVAGQYRDDSERVYEDIDPQLHDVLSQMLDKDPEQRIKLRDIKRHPWVLHGIADTARWLEETDPARPSSGRRIQVDEREMTDAVVPLKFLERARSTFKKTVDKIISPLTERAESRSRRRAASSAASSVAGNDSFLNVAALPSLPSTPWSRDLRRSSFRGEEQLSSQASSATEHPLTSAASVPASPGEEVGYDPLATVLASGNLHHHQQQLQQQHQQNHHPYGQNRSGASPLPFHTRSDSMAVETGSEPDIYQHQHHLLPTTSLGPIRRANYPRPLSYVFPMHRSPRLEPQTVPSTPMYDESKEDPMQMPLAMTIDRDAVERETSRSRSVDRALFSTADKHAEAKVGLTQAVARGSSSLRARRPRQMRSVDLSRAFNGASTTQHSPAQPFSPRALPTEYRHAYPGSDSDVRRQRSQTEARSTPSQRQEDDDQERRVSLPFVNSASSAGSFSPLEESYLRQNMEERSQSHLRMQPTICEGCVSPASIPCPASPTVPSYRRHYHRHSQPSSREETMTVAKSSRSTSYADLGTPMTSPSAASSPVSGMPGGKGHTEQFQSDPSLPALLSGASSVSTDLEGELLLRPGIVSHTAALLETTDSLTPPALQKEPMTGFPLEAAFDGEGARRPGLLSLDFQAAKDHESQRPMSSPMAMTPVDERDDDSDSDEGFVMKSKRRSRRPTDVGPRPAPPVYKRRNTNASTGSNETAKKVVVVDVADS